MKKIEKMSGYSEVTMKLKINEIIDRLNQSVSQPEIKNNTSRKSHDGSEDIPQNLEELVLPEPVMRVAPKQSDDDIELVFEKCDKNFLKSIVENNTEEWEKEFKSIAKEFYDRQSDVEIVDLVRFIEQLLSKRSFSKEELRYIRSNLDWNAGITGQARMFNKILARVDRLLSSESN